MIDQSRTSMASIDVMDELYCMYKFSKMWLSQEMTVHTRAAVCIKSIYQKYSVEM